MKMINALDDIILDKYDGLERLIMYLDESSPSIVRSVVNYEKQVDIVLDSLKGELFGMQE